MPDLARGDELISHCEDKIRQISDVISARIVTSNQGKIEEIHVLIGDRAIPKKTIGDIAEVLKKELDMIIDSKKVSVAQIQGDKDITQSNSQFRPQLVSVNMLSFSVNAEARVQLNIGEELFSGVAEGPKSVNNKYKLIVNATLKALKGYLRGNCSLVAEDLQILSIAQKKVVVVYVSLLTSFSEEGLLGTAFIKNDEGEAIVRATLDAINRRLALLINQ